MSSSDEVDGMAGSPTRSVQSVDIPPTPIQMNLNDNENGDDESSMMVPGTPVSRSRVPNAAASTLSTPLTPISDIHNMNENTNDNDTLDDSDEEEDPIPMVVEQDEEEEEAVAETLIRGTDVHVPTAAATFTSFLREFISLKHSQKSIKQKEKEDNDNDNDNDNDSSVDSNDDQEDGDERPPLYLSKLQDLMLRGTFLQDPDNTTNMNINSNANSSLDIDTMHLYYHNPQCQKFYYQLVAYPMEMVPLMDLVVQRELQHIATDNGNDANVPQIQVRPFNLRNLSTLRCLDPVSLDSLLSIQGMVVRTSTVIPDLKVAHFGCTICGHDARVTIDRGRIQEPTSCPQCQCRHSYTLLHNRSVFADKQLCRVQETPDEVPAGQTPASVVTFCFDDLVDSIKPGDRVEVTGVLRAQPKRVNPKVSKIMTVYKTYIDVIHFRRITSGGRKNKNDENSSANDCRTGMHVKFTEERIDELKRLSRLPDIYQQLTASMAPSIWELDNTKKGVLCMLFGGNNRRVQVGTAEKKQKKDQRIEQRRKRDGRFSHDDDSASGVDSSDNEDEDEDEDDGSTTNTRLNKRGDINILLCGDPGTSKSQLLSYVNKLCSRGVYTSGKGSSAVGLTASVVRDPETRDLVLESGALVLSDLGICCIDEFDKMSDATRSVLHEAMEQQTVSIAKAGIIATLNARTAILASANPIESRYNPSKSVVENIQLPPTLLSRFDLIYLILDSPNVDHDRQLAQHLVGLYYETPNVVKPPLDQDILRDYIEYAREYVHPELTDEATDELISNYLQMRNMGGGNNNSGKKTISATPRQLESLIRLSEGLAKMRYSYKVTRNDAREAVRLMRVATQAAATDPRTGKIDMDMIATGRSTADREMEVTLNLHLKELLAERRGNRMAVRDVTRQLAEITNTVVAQGDVVEGLRRMEADGVIQFNERAQTVFVRAGVVA